MIGAGRRGGAKPGEKLNLNPQNFAYLRKAFLRLIFLQDSRPAAALPSRLQPPTDINGWYGSASSFLYRKYFRCLTWA